MGSFTYGLTVAFDQPYRTQTATATSLVPPAAPFEVSIGGRGYPVDTEFKPYLRDAFRHRSIAAQREAIDLTNEPGEGTVNVEDLWRRGQNTWVLGAGQPYLDRKGSSPNRFWQSKGVETAFTWQLTMLPKAVQVYATTNASVAVLVVSDTVYVADGTTIKYSTNLATWATVTGGPSGTGVEFKSWATNGNTIWIAWGRGGIYKTTVGAGGMNPYVTKQPTGTTPAIITLVGWAGIYLMASSGPALYGGGGTFALTGITSRLPATTLFTHPNPAWVWVDTAWGDSEVYIAGYVNITGGSGAIFRTTTTTTGVNLLVPSLALPLEGGERPYCIFPYLNFEFIGTNLGVRMCRTISAYDPSGNAGDLEAGAIQPNIFQQLSGGPVLGITAHNRFVYFGWTKFDATSSGLGRLDISNFVDELTPAYVSDIMVPVQHHVAGCDWLTTTGTILDHSGAYSSPVVAVAFSGLWVNTPNARETTGYVDSGYITYGIPDDKVALQLSARAQNPLTGSLTGYLSVDQPLAQNYSEVGETFATSSRAPWTITQVRGEQYQVRIELNSDGTTGPTFNRWLLKSYPAVVSGKDIIVPLTLFREITEQGLVRPLDPYAEYAYLDGLRTTQQVISYVEGPFQATAIITAITWIPYAEQGRQGDRAGYNATCVVNLKTFPQTNS